MIDEQALADWLTALPTALSVKFNPGPRKIEFVRADTAGLVSMLPGAGLAPDGLFDQPSFQVEIVGRERDRTGLRQSMELVDQTLIGLDSPGALWGTWVNWVGRTGSGPAQGQEDEQDRISWACSYLAVIPL